MFMTAFWVKCPGRLSLKLDLAGIHNFRYDNWVVAVFNQYDFNAELTAATIVKSEHPIMQTVPRTQKLGHIIWSRSVKEAEKKFREYCKCNSGANL